MSLNSYFGSDYLNREGELIPSSRTDEDIDVIASLAPSRSQPILDVGCGHGRHLKRLTAMGYDHLFGVDFSPAALERLSESQTARATIQLVDIYVPGNLAKFASGQKFAVVYSLYNSAFYGSVVQNQKLLLEMGSLVADGGYLVIEALDNDAMQTLMKTAQALPVRLLLSLRRGAKTLLGRFGADVTVGRAWIERDYLRQSLVVWERRAKREHSIVSQVVDNDELVLFLSTSGFRCTRRLVRRDMAVSIFRRERP